MLSKSQLRCVVCANNHVNQAFISHSSKDSHIARKTAMACCNAGVIPYLYECSTDFYNGLSPRDVLETRVKQSEILLVLLGPGMSGQFPTQSWIGHEIGLFRDSTAVDSDFQEYFSRRVIVVGDVRQGIETTIPRLDALLLFDFSADEEWDLLNDVIRFLVGSDDSDLEFFSLANAIRERIMSNSVRCDNETCRNEYDVWLRTEDANLLDDRIEWIHEGIKANCQIECPSCENRDLTLILQRSL